MLRPFHLAIPTHNVQESRKFYTKILGCEEGRSSAHWIDFNLYGHQLVVHLKEGYKGEALGANAVDGKAAPIPHFGIVLTMKDWKILAQRLKKNNIKFIIEPYIRFEGQKGEQATLFFADPSGNALEFKAFEDLDQLFEK